MNSEKTPIQFGNETADSLEDTYGLLTIALVEITQIDLLESAVVTDFERAQGRDGFHQSCFLRWALRKIFLIEAPVNTGKPMTMSKFF
jgi:hypothetical protein